MSSNKLGGVATSRKLCRVRAAVKLDAYFLSALIKWQPIEQNPDDITEGAGQIESAREIFDKHSIARGGM